MDYSTILQVPNTRNSALLNSLAKHEIRLTNITGYNVKLVEQSGVQLSRSVQKNFSVTKCHWSECATCCEMITKIGRGVESVILCTKVHVLNARKTLRMKK